MKRFIIEHKEAESILLSLGYQKRKYGDYIYPNTNGRFHATKEIDGKMKVHYDFIIDGKHVSNLPLHNLVYDEYSRIMEEVKKTPIIKNV